MPPLAVTFGRGLPNGELDRHCEVQERDMMKLAPELFGDTLPQRVDCSQIMPPGPVASQYLDLGPADR